MNLDAMTAGKSTSRERGGKIKVLVVDDHPLFRAGLIKLLSGRADLEVVGEVDTAPAVVAAVEKLAPDLMLLDLRLRNADGIELIKSPKPRYPNLLILVVSQYEESMFAERSLRAGASGYVMKQEASEEVMTAIQTVLDGDLYVSRKIAVMVFRQTLDAHKPAPGVVTEHLTDRELHIFQLLGSGMSVRQIAHEFNLSVKTVESHREHIKNKLGFQSAGELAAGATRWVAEHLLPPAHQEVEQIWPEDGPA